MFGDAEAEKAFLRTVPVFGGFEGAALDRIQGVLKDLELPAGQIACREGELGRQLFVVRRGEVEVQRDVRGSRVPLVRLGPGECFGEMTLIEIQPRSATVTAVEDTALYTMGKSDLISLYREDVQTYALLLGNICRELARRLRKADQQIAELKSRQ